MVFGYEIRRPLLLLLEAEESERGAISIAGGERAIMVGRREKLRTGSL